MSCKICGTRHNASIGGYCKFHQSDRAEAAERTAAELRARIDNLEQEIAELRGELKMSYTSDDPRITVNEWQAETPYGQMLDGLGDEVEP